MQSLTQNRSEILAGYFADKSQDIDINVHCSFLHQDWAKERYFLVTVTGGCLGLCGILGNILVLMIFCKPQPSSPNHVFITVLAASDVCVLVSAMLLYCVEHTVEYFRSLSLYSLWLCYVQPVYGVSHTAQTTSVYITVVGNIERYFAISPNVEQRKGHPIRSVGGSVIFASLVVAFAVAFNYPKFLEISVIHNPNCTGFAAHLVRPSWLAVHPMYQRAYSLWATAFVMVFVPFFSLLALNILTIQRTHHVISRQEGMRRRRRMLSMDQQGRLSIFGHDLHLNQAAKEATVVFILIVTTFLLCNVWGFILTLIEHLYGVKTLREHYRKFYSFSREVVNFLGILNASVNFFIYVLFSGEFRNALRKNFRRRAYYFKNLVMRNRATNPEIRVDTVLGPPGILGRGRAEGRRPTNEDLMRESFSYLSLETIV